MCNFKKSDQMGPSNRHSQELVVIRRR